MNVKELIELLQKENPEELVILQKDGEGNGYSPLCAVETCAYTADSTWSGEVGFRELTDELRAGGYSEEDVGGSDAVHAVVLCPIN
jgi:hypothetical protein